MRGRLIASSIAEGGRMNPTNGATRTASSRRVAFGFITGHSLQEHCRTVCNLTASLVSSRVFPSARAASRSHYGCRNTQKPQYVTDRCLNAAVAKRSLDRTGAVSPARVRPRLLVSVPKLLLVHQQL